MSWEWGYGAPAGLGTPGAGEECPWGYGDPAGGTFGEGIESGGYGSVFSFFAASIGVLPLPFGAVPDEGGPVITLTGVFPIRGPWRVRFVNVNGDVFPGDGSYCWNLTGPNRRTDNGWDVFTDLAQGSMSFGLPVLPPQPSYDVRLYWGPNFTLTLDVPDVLEVVYRQRDATTYRLRLTLPPWMATGPRMLSQEVLDLATFPGAGYVGVPATIGPEWPHGPLAELLHSTAQELAATVGTPQTRLTADLDPADTTAHVESTLEFGATGAVFIAGDRFTYTGKTAYTLTGVTTGTDRVVSYPRWAPVSLEVLSTPDATPTNGRLQAMRDTTCDGASGDDLVSLSRFLSVPYISGWDEPSWQQAMRAFAMGPRSLPGGTWGFLRGAFAFAETDIACTVAAANPTRLTRTAGVFTGEDISRMFEVNGELYFSTGIGGGGAYVTLAPVATSYWSAANWTANASVTATQLAFTVEEPTPGPLETGIVDIARPAAVVVRLWLDTVDNVPPTYLQADGTVVRPVGEPYGGAILEDAFEAGDPSHVGPTPPVPVGGGPFPPYLVGGGTLAELSDVLKASLPPGFFVYFRRRGG